LGIFPISDEQKEIAYATIADVTASGHRKTRTTCASFVSRLIVEPFQVKFSCRMETLARQSPKPFCPKGQTMKATKLYEALHALIGERVPLHIWGACGVGKSQIVYQVADDLSYDFLDVRAGLLDRHYLELTLGR
jgi:hypothetical protein